MIPVRSTSSWPSIIKDEPWQKKRGTSLSFFLPRFNSVHTVEPRNHAGLSVRRYAPRVELWVINLSLHFQNKIRGSGETRYFSHCLSSVQKGVNHTFTIGEMHGDEAGDWFILLFFLKADPIHYGVTWQFVGNLDVPSGEWNVTSFCKAHSECTAANFASFKPCTFQV